MDWLKKHAKKLKKVAMAAAIGAALYNAQKIGQLPAKAKALESKKQSSDPRYQYHDFGTQRPEWTDPNLHRPTLDGGRKRKTAVKRKAVVKRKTAVKRKIKK